jgi:hypothetical protein
VTEQASEQQEQRTDQRDEQGGEQQGQTSHDGKIGLDRDDEEQSFVDKSKIDFDPDDGLYSGTAVDGSSEIPGPHQDNESGEVDYDEARREAEEGGVDPEDTPAAKSPVAKAAEAEREGNDGGGEQEDPGDANVDEEKESEPMPDPGPH